MIFPSYFSSPVINELEDYTQLYREAGKSYAIGEACVAYLFHYEQTIPRIKKILGNPLIIIILRNPIDRAFSHYLELKLSGIEKLTFEEAIREESKRKEAGRWWWSSQYVNTSRYANQVESYINAFGRNQVTIFLFEEFANNPQNVIKSIFLKIGPWMILIFQTLVYDINQQASQKDNFGPNL